MAERPNPDPDPNPILSINDNRLVRLGSLTPLTSLAAWTIVKRPLEDKYHVPDPPCDRH